MSDDAYYMSLALQEAQRAYEQDEVPVGCVIVAEGKVLATAHNACERLHNPTAHAEMLAMERVRELYGREALQGAVLYVTVEPCAMCAGAIWLSRIPRVVYGALEHKTGAVHTLFNVLTHPLLNHQAQVCGGVLEEQCAELMRRFFMGKRSK